MRKFGLAAAMSLLSICAVKDGCFVLREYGGKIALFRESDAQPIAVYQTPVSGLCPADEELLREGIRLRSATEVTRIIEDLDLN